MESFHGVIIEESLADKEVLKQVEVISTKVEPVTDRHHTPWLSQWTLHQVAVPAGKADAVAERLSVALECEHPWYADFNNETTHYIIFRGRVFKINRRSKEEYDQAKQYGLSLGIAAHQVDFHPEVADGKR